MHPRRATGTRGKQRSPSPQSTRAKIRSDNGSVLSSVENAATFTWVPRTSTPSLNLSRMPRALAWRNDLRILQSCGPKIEGQTKRKTWGRVAYKVQRVPNQLELDLLIQSSWAVQSGARVHLQKRSATSLLETTSKKVRNTCSVRNVTVWQHHRDKAPP